MEALALKDRENQIFVKGESTFDIVCNKDSLAGAVSQRACVFCGSRVVLYPIADAVHLVHGPIGCAVYTWDIRGALSSGPELHRLSFSTDLQETDVIFGGEKKLTAALRELIERHQPKAAFVYSTCIVGIIGDDLEAVCRAVEAGAGLESVRGIAWRDGEGVRFTPGRDFIRDLDTLPMPVDGNAAKKDNGRTPPEGAGRRTKR